ncbi:MAG: flagellar basal-body MS-ring/collar protein FliF [Desulfuromonadaceae bacterium]|nr:flagellar basal-body MS-ring/collar protein FliF [Desulfuromonadaceae bacterium]
MPEGIRKLVEPFFALSPGKQMVIATVAFLSAAAFAILIFVANRTDYRPLFTNLTSEDAGEIVKKLKDAKTPYQITADGKGILVPSDKVYELRLTLASEGIPQGGGVGFEIFDRKNFGMTEFVQKINYQRALQGELSRTIAQLSGVDQVRVHLVIPEKSLFRDNERPATASIVLKMKSNRTLTDSEVQGVVHLVSASIEGMDPEQVTILDSRGKMLSKGGNSDPAARLTSAMQETERAYDRNAEERIQSLLDRIVGGGKSVARVTATFDFKQVERVEEKFDPDTIAVRSEQRTDEKGSSTTASAGVPGVQTNLGRTPTGGGATSGGGTKSDETLNYEVSRSSAKIIEPVGALSKISIAVLVDGKYEAPAAVKEGQVAKAKYIPRSPEEMQKIETLVKSAVGYNAERGDQLSVQNIPFQDTDEGGTVEKTTWWTNPFFMSLAKNLMIGIGFLVLVLFVIRPLLASLRLVKRPALESFEAIGSSGEQLTNAERALINNQMAEQQNLIEQAKKDPYQVAQILQNWVAEDK